MSDQETESTIKLVVNNQVVRKTYDDAVGKTFAAMVGDMMRFVAGEGSLDFTKIEAFQESVAAQEHAVKDPKGTMVPIRMLGPQGIDDDYGNAVLRGALKFTAAFIEDGNESERYKATNEEFSAAIVAFNRHAARKASGR
jgi:hypothetical protein